jgi:hypothetical protein
MGTVTQNQIEYNRQISEEGTFFWLSREDLKAETES